MKNLMTRKLLFGMLMVLVLAFSVQGIAEALSSLSREWPPHVISLLKILQTTFDLQALLQSPDRC